jgi:Ca2+-binding EF-hand superfamily protein
VKKLQAKAGSRSLFDGASFFSPAPVDPAVLLQSSLVIDNAQVSSWKVLFNKHLKPGCSTIGLADVQSIVRSAGVDAGQSEVVALFKECDADGSGAIDAVEFEVLMKMITSMTTRKQSSRSFFSIFKF